MEHATQYASPRPEMLPFIPAVSKVLLDVGCGDGGFGAAIRSARPDLETWAVEPDERAAQVASSHYDHVLHSPFPSGELPSGMFDAIFFNDVLEHMYDPTRAVEACASLLTQTGVIVAAIPNVRHLTALAPLALRGDWTYSDQGILDRTHVRFFTRSTMISLFNDAGWDVVSVTGINRRLKQWQGDRTRWSWLSKLTAGRSDDFLFLNYVIIARPTGRPTT